ncbi:MAG: LysE family translocator [Polaribacter sp.]
MLETLFSFVIATTILVISPGPDNMLVLTQSIVYGKKFGLVTVFGLMSGCIIHTTLVAFGISAIIKENEELFFIIKLLGALYLLFLAYKVYKSDAKILISPQNSPQKTTLQLFKTGFLMNVLNPKVTIFFLAFFPQFLFSKEISTIFQFYVLGFLFILVSFVIFGLIAVLAGRISTYLKQHPKTGMYLKWAQIVVFVCIAMLILI